MMSWLFTLYVMLMVYVCNGHKGGPTFYQHTNMEHHVLGSCRRVCDTPTKFLKCLQFDQDKMNNMPEMPVNMTIGYFGDQGVSSNALAVLQMMKNEGVEAIVHAGDFGYIDGQPPDWNAQMNSVFGQEDFPYFMVLGNHDAGESQGWHIDDSYAAMYERMSRLGICEGHNGAQMVCVYKGLVLVLTTPGLHTPYVTDNNHDLFVRESLLAHESVWRTCVFHKNQHLMQLGGKTNDPGWDIYDECRRWGALVATGHEHSFARSHAMSGFKSLSVVPPSSDPIETIRMTVENDTQSGVSLAFVSGVAGRSLRHTYSGEDLTKKPWWATALTLDTTPPVQYGAVICKYRLNGDPNRAYCYFKDIDGAVLDEFFMESTMLKKSNRGGKGGKRGGKRSKLSMWDLQVSNPQQEFSTSSSNWCSSLSEHLPLGNDDAAFFEFPAFEFRADTPVERAYLRFTAHNNGNANAAQFEVRVELSSSPKSPCNGRSGSSTRVFSEASVKWEPPVFDEEYMIAETPDLSPLLLELRDKGHYGGKSLVFRIIGMGERQSGTRQVYSVRSKKSCVGPRLIVHTRDGKPQSSPSRSHTNVVVIVLPLFLGIVVLLSLLVGYFRWKERRRYRSFDNEDSTTRTATTRRSGELEEMEIE